MVGIVAITVRPGPLGTPSTPLTRVLSRERPREVPTPANNANAAPREALRATLGEAGESGASAGETTRSSMLARTPPEASVATRASRFSAVELAMAAASSEIGRAHV